MKESKIDKSKAVKKYFESKGGFKVGNGNYIMIDNNESIIYTINTKEMKVKLYTIGNGGFNWEESLTIEEFLSNSK